MRLMHPEDAPRFGADINQLVARPGGLMLVRIRERHRDGHFPVIECAYFETVRSVAETGVDYISIGGITKHVRAVELSMRLAFAS